MVPNLQVESNLWICVYRGLYIFNPIFEDHFFVLKEVFPENSALMYG